MRLSGLQVKLSVQCQAAAATKDAQGGVNVHSDAFQVIPSPHSENSLHTNIETLVGYFTGESKLSSKRPSPSKLSGSSGASMVHSLVTMLSRLKCLLAVFRQNQSSWCRAPVITPADDLRQLTEQLQ